MTVFSDEMSFDVLHLNGERMKGEKKMFEAGESQACMTLLIWSESNGKERYPGAGRRSRAGTKGVRRKGKERRARQTDDSRAKPQWYQPVGNREYKEAEGERHWLGA